MLQDVGRIAAQRVRSLLQSGSTLAVTGGATMAQVAHFMSSPTPMNVMVVPARGGMGRAVETQANTLAAEIARKIGGHHRLMHLPDHMDAGRHAGDVQAAGNQGSAGAAPACGRAAARIGRADDMARNRQMSMPQLRQLLDKGAVAEAFGYYFDAAGECLYSASSVGVDLVHLSPTCQMVAVAAGRRKAQAMLAVLKRYRHTMLVTDEGPPRRCCA